jgi:hypothetical protein
MAVILLQNTVVRSTKNWLSGVKFARLNIDVTNVKKIGKIHKIVIWKNRGPRWGSGVGLTGFNEFKKNG